MKYNGKFCIVCGRRIPELSLKRRVCSEFCRRRYKGGYAPYKDYKELPFADLTAVQEDAQQAGMTYGQYVATKYEKEECTPMPRKMTCPFFKGEKALTLSCEGAEIKFPDKDGRNEFVLGYCANHTDWSKCPIAHCLENYYLRK